MSESLAIGIDLGGTKIASALVSDNGNVLASRFTLTDPAKGPGFVLDRIAEEIKAMLLEAGGPVAGIGIGSPGNVMPIDGVVRNAVNLGWTDVPIISEIRSRLGMELPIFIHSDKNACALGEYYFGAAKGCQDFVYLAIGTGLGGGIIANGHLVVGTGWDAGEVGHMTLDPNGRLCACGLRGCAETIVSGPGLIAVTREKLVKKSHATSLADSPELNTTEILAAGRAGDQLAIASIQEVGAQLGVVMATCVAILNPALFVIGGGLGLAAYDFLEPAARLEMLKRVIYARYCEQQIVRSHLTFSAIGPACLVWENYKGGQGWKP
jgi:glucokinase